MNTFTSEQLSDVAALLESGGVVAIPTDTVYGLAARVDHPESVRRLFALKLRPKTTPLPLLVADLHDGQALLEKKNLRLEQLGVAFWPGALTVVVDCPPGLARLVGTGDDSVGLRVPDDQLVLDLLTLTGPLVVSSANLHGEPPCTRVQAVIDIFGGEHNIDGVLDGGVKDAEPSAVVKISGDELIEIRSGAIQFATIQSALTAND